MLALDRNSESHSAVSPVDSGGMLAGGADGSNVRLAKATGCLMMVGAEASLGCWRDDDSRHASQPRKSTPTSTQITIKRRKVNQPPYSILRIRLGANHEFVAANDGKGTLSERLGLGGFFDPLKSAC